jgi:hypothetical protein
MHIYIIPPARQYYDALRGIRRGSQSMLGRDSRAADKFVPNRTKPHRSGLGLGMINTCISRIKPPVKSKHTNFSYYSIQI